MAEKSLDDRIKEAELAIKEVVDMRGTQIT